MRPLRIAWILAALSLLLRVALVAQAGRFELPERAWDRGYEVGAVARSVAEGRGFSDPFGEATGPTAAIGPGVVMLWALPMRALGTGSPLAWALIVLLDCVALSLVVPALFLLGRRVAGERFGLLCALLWSLHPVALLLARGYLSSLAWYAPAVVIVVERMLAVEQRMLAVEQRMLAVQESKRPPWPSLGVAFGLSLWVEPLLAPIVAAWIVLAFARRRPHARPALLAALLAGLIVSPWIVRNAVVMGTPSLRAAAGPELWLGALAGPGEDTPIRVHPSRNRLELERLAAVGERAFNQEKLAAAKEIVAADPARWMRACAWRLGNFWLGRLAWWRTSGEHPIVGGPLSALRGALHAGLALLALAGLVSAWRTVPATRLLALVLAVYPLVYALTHVEARYRLPLEPLLTLAAGLLLLRSPRFSSTPPVRTDP